MRVANITSFDEFTKIINGDKAVVVDFWADWSAPCKAISPFFEQLSADNGDVEFYKVNIDDVAEAAKAASIRGIPAFICFKKGEKVREITGTNTNEMKALISQAVILQN